MEVYNKNRDNNKGIHDEIREQNAKLKDATLKEKLIYFKDYYLIATICIICGVIFVIALIHSMLSGPQDTAFAAYFFNDTGDSSNTALADSFAQFMEIDTAEHDVYIDATLFYRNDDEPQSADNIAVASTTGAYEIYTNLQKTMAMIAANDLDVIAGDESTIGYFARSECFADVSTILNSEQLTKYKDYFYYFTNEETGETIPVGIIINDAPKIKQYHYYDLYTGIMGFVTNTEDMDNALAFLDYIFTE